jgi:DNA-binding transcriptional regulator GbsR (MarR family)
MTARRAGRRPAQPDWRENFVEEPGVLAGDVGLPRAVARVLAWMVVCKPAEQSATTFRPHPTLSAGTVSAATRMLVATQLLERTARPADRRIHYRLRPGGWERALEARLRASIQLREVADRALHAANGRRTTAYARCARSTHGSRTSSTNCWAKDAADAEPSTPCPAARCHRGTVIDVSR